MNYKQREIVLVPFPYSDLSATKRRPVLIVSNNDYNDAFADVVVCVITSNQFEDDYSVLLSNHDLETGILPETSVVKTHKLFTIEQTKILRKFSLVKEKFYDLIENKLHELFEKNTSL
jgi:mRNA interferase MazF